MIFLFWFYSFYRPSKDSHEWILQLCFECAWYSIYAWECSKLISSLYNYSDTSIHSKGIAQHNNHNWDNEYAPGDADRSDNSAKGWLRLEVSVADWSHHDYSHIQHIKIDGQSRLFLVNLYLGHSEKHGKGKKTEQENDNHEWYRRVFEYRPHGKGYAWFDIIHSAYPICLRRSIHIFDQENRWVCSASYYTE